MYGYFPAKFLFFFSAQLFLSTFIRVLPNNCIKFIQTVSFQIQRFCSIAFFINLMMIKVPLFFLGLNHVCICAGGPNHYTANGQNNHCCRRRSFQLAYLWGLQFGWNQVCNCAGGDWWAKSLSSQHPINIPNRITRHSFVMNIISTFVRRSEAFLLRFHNKR